MKKKCLRERWTFGVDSWTVWSYLGSTLTRRMRVKRIEREKYVDHFRTVKNFYFCALDVFGGAAIAGHTTTTTTTTTPVVLREREPSQYISIYMNTCVFSLIWERDRFLSILLLVALFSFSPSVCLSHSASQWLSLWNISLDLSYDIIPPTAQGWTWWHSLT